MRVLALGNSFARDFINTGFEASNLGRSDVSYSTIEDCAGPLPAATRALAQRADFIVMGSGVDSTRPYCSATRYRELAGIGRARIIVLSTKGFGWNNNAVMMIDARTRYGYRIPARDLPLADAAAGARLYPASIYVNILALMGDRDGRIPVFTPEHTFISQDRKHLTRDGARYVGRHVFRHPALQALQRAIDEAPAERALGATQVARSAAR